VEVERSVKENERESRKREQKGVLLDGKPIFSAPERLTDVLFLPKIVADRVLEKKGTGKKEKSKRIGFRRERNRTRIHEKSRQELGNP